MTKEYFLKKQLKNGWIWCIITSVCFILGVVIGGIYCARADVISQTGIYKYLNNFVSTFETSVNNFNIFKNSFNNNIKLFLVIFVCAFFKFGFVPVCGSVCVKGFTTGFTSTALLKYYGFKGVWLILSNITSTLILVPALIFFACCSIKMSFIDKKKERETLLFFIILSFFILTIFCASSLIDGYVNTILMKFSIQRLS